MRALNIEMGKFHEIVMEKVTQSFSEVFVTS